MTEVQPVARKLRLSQVAINVFHWPGSGPSMLLLHGAGGNGLWWGDVAGTLGGHFQLYAPDMRGHGDSDKPANGYSIGEVVEDIRVLADALNLDRPILVGHSYTAKALMYYADHLPRRTRALVLVDPTPPEAFRLTPEELEASLQPLLMELGPHATWEDAQRLARTLPQYRRWNQHLERAFRHGLLESSDGTVMGKTASATIREIASQCMAMDTTPSLSGIEARALLLTSSESEAVLKHSERISRHIEQCVWKVLQGNHWLYTDNAEEFHGVVVGFLAEVLRE